MQMRVLCTTVGDMQTGMRPSAQRTAGSCQVLDFGLHLGFSPSAEN